jgi:hypothetical protein
MRLAVLGERLDQMGIRFVSVGLERIDHQAESAVRHDCPLERRIGLETHDHFIFTIDVPWSMRRDGAGNLRDIEYPLLALLHKKVSEDFPDLLGTLGCWSEK